MIQTKAENKQAVYRYILQNGPVSKQDLFSGLSLSMPTIKQALEYLSDQGLIDGSEIVNNTGGRNASAYKILDTGRTAIGISFSAHHITGAVIDLYGNVLVMKRRRRPLDVHNEEYLKALGALVEEQENEISLDKNCILGVGIAVPSLVSADGERIIYGMTHDFTGITRRVLSRYIPYHTVMLHDSYAAAFAEMWNNTSVKNAYYLNLNNSIGGCFIVNNTVFLGDHHLAGEIGHIIIEPRGGRPCYCGHTGCFDTVCNAGILDSYTNGDLEAFFELLKKNDEGARRIWDEYLDNLALALHNVRMLLDCPVILGGYVGPYMPAYIDELCTRLDRLSAFSVPARDYVLTCKYKLDATAAGAAISLVEDFIQAL